MCRQHFYGRQPGPRSPLRPGGAERHCLELFRGHRVPGGVVVVVIDIKIICFSRAFPTVGSIMISESVTNIMVRRGFGFQSGDGKLWFLGKIQ